MRVSVVLRGAVAVLAGGTVALLPSRGGAQQFPRSINTPPNGAGTPAEVGPLGGAPLRPGVEASVALGTGFADTYGLGFEGRVGYTFRDGIYVGGAGQHYLGHSINDQQAHATFVGGEVGYKFYPTGALEVRPYAFVGPGFITQVSAGPLRSLSKADLAVQPGIVAMYHFGDAFVGGDAHVMLMPAPNTLALLASGGFGF